MRMRIAFSSATRLATLALFGGAAPRLLAQRTPVVPLAITGVTVIDPASAAAPLRDHTLIIAGGVITTIGPSATTRVPADARRLSGGGKFLIPGLWDAHVHFMNTGRSALPLLLAHGVTSVREMGGFIDSTRVWQAGMAAGTLDGPRIVTPGPILESPRYLQGVRDRSARARSQLADRVLPYRIGIADSQDARRAIDSLLLLHADFVKVRTTATPAAFFAILREARRAGLAVAAHQPGGVGIAAAMDSGLTDMEHALQPASLRLTAAARDSIYRSFVRNDAWYTPTLAVSHALTLSGDSANRAIFGRNAARWDPRLRYASPWLLGWWRMQVDERMLDTAAGRAATMEEGWRSTIADVRRMHELGVKLLAGTDAGSVLVYPGFSLHDELALLVQEGGLSPRDALWSATSGPATFARLGDRVGRIAPGMTADLVLLDADPLADIRNTRRIAAVIQGGRVYSRRALDRLLCQARPACRDRRDRRE